MILCLDAGHGGSDSGASGCGIRECDVALMVCKKIRYYALQAGHTVVMTREDDTDVYGPHASLVDELQARCDISDNANADYCLSIHCNAFDTSAKGTETFYYVSSSKGLGLASYVQNEIIALGDLINRGVKNTPLYMTKHPQAVAILVELAFIDNEKDSAKLGNDDWQDAFAQAILRGLVGYDTNK